MATEISSRPPERSAAADEPLDWHEFCARRFPGHRERHDFEAASAYAAYRQGRREEPRATASGTTSGPDEVARGLSSWEGEGGAAAR